jgi:hypothetical protein
MLILVVILVVIVVVVVVVILVVIRLVDAHRSRPVSLDVVDRCGDLLHWRPDLDGSTDGAQAFADLLQRPWNDATRGIAGVAFGESDVEGDLQVDEPVAEFVANPRPLDAGDEPIGFTALPRHEIEIDRPARSDPGEEELDRCEVGIRRRADADLATARIGRDEPVRRRSDEVDVSRIGLGRYLWLSHGLTVPPLGLGLRTGSPRAQR